MYEIFEREQTVDVLISTTPNETQACLAAWSRAKRNGSYTWVQHATTGNIIDEYDFVHLNVVSNQQQSYDLDFA
jgi:hypothetical protein